LRTAPCLAEPSGLHSYLSMSCCACTSSAAPSPLPARMSMTCGSQS